MATTTLPQRTESRHVKRLDDVHPVMAKAEVKNLDPSWRHQIGHAIGRAFAIAGLTRKEAAGLLDRDEGQIARWVSGVDRPLFDALFAVQVLRKPLIQSLAELADDVLVETVIRMRSEGR